MTILALEFSSEQRSAAVARGGSILAEAVESGERNVWPPFAMIEKVLARAKMEREDIETIAVGLGPGSYTGVRAAIALAQWLASGAGNKDGWALAASRPIAEQARMENFMRRVNIVRLDAQRRGNLYFAAYDLAQTSWTELMPLKILSVAEVQSCANDGEILIGPEVVKIFPNGRSRRFFRARRP